MVVAVVVFVVSLGAALMLLGVLGLHRGGWTAILLGASGVIYATVTYPTYGIIIVIPLSVLWILIGCVALVSSHLRQRRL